MKHFRALLAATPIMAILALPAVAATAPAVLDPAAPSAAPVADTAAAAAETVAAIVDKGDVSWMMVSSLLVLFMIVPGLALFYGGLVRAKNMLSVLMQCTTITAVVMIVWVFWGYSFAFGDTGNAFFGGWDKLFLKGVTLDSLAATFTEGVSLPEYVFISFQMTFACITPALIIGAFAERIKFPAVVLFVILWATFVYFPIAHMVWDGGGLLYDRGILDFAGGTVVHINAGIAGLVGSLVVGKRIGLGKDLMAPHSMTLTMVGASILWVGWFGFNAGSNLEATAGATLAVINTFVATAGAIVSWVVIESLTRGKASMLGAASGLVAGLVAVTPAAGYVGPVGAIVLGIVASAGCYVFVAVVKPALGYDDSLDAFGVHGIGGVIGAVGTGILNDPALGGIGAGGRSMGEQVWIQVQGVALTVVWCAIGSFILYWVVKLVIGLRVSPEAEREGLDLSSHGEAAYHS